MSACNPSNSHRSNCFGPLSREISPSRNLPTTSPDDITTVKNKDTSTTGSFRICSNNHHKGPSQNRFYKILFKVRYQNVCFYRPAKFTRVSHSQVCQLVETFIHVAGRRVDDTNFITIILIISGLLLIVVLFKTKTKLPC